MPGSSSMSLSVLPSTKPSEIIVIESSLPT